MSKIGKALARPFERVGDIDVPMRSRNFIISNIVAFAFLGIFILAILYTLALVAAEKLHIVRRLQ